MKNERFQQSIDRCLSSVELRPELRNKILEQCFPAAAHTKKATYSKTALFRRCIACAAVFCIILATGLICVASGLPFQVSLSRLSGEIAMMLTPVNTTSYSNGIEMNVLAAMSDQEVVVVYLTLRDTEQKHRLDGTVQLIDFSTECTRLGHASESVFSHTEVLWYDEQTQTATIRLTGQGMRGIENSKFSLSLHALLAGRNEFFSVPTGHTLSDVRAFNPLPTVSYPSSIPSYDCSGLLSEKLSELVEQGKMPVLNKSSAASFTVADFPWFSIENIAVLDNFLHVRISYDQNMGRFNQLFVRLGEKGSENLFETSELSMDLEYYQPDEFHCYPSIQEQVIAIPGEKLYQDVEIHADVVTYDHYIEGEWNATFQIENAQEHSVSQTCSIDMGTWKINDVTISPIGVSVSATGELFAHSTSPDIIVTRTDGSVIECNSSSMTTDGKNILFKDIFETPLKTKEIAYVTINDVELCFLDTES